MWRTRRVSQLIAVVGTMLAILACGGCSNGTPLSNTKANQKEMDAIAQQIQTTLAQQPGVTRAEVGYQNNLDASAQAGVVVYVGLDTDQDPIIDEAIRLVWTSKLNPLDSISVDVAVPQDPTKGTTKHVRALSADERASLDNKYGPHPAK
jgi:hypothetical protein